MSGLSKMIADFFVRENVIEHEEYEIYKYGSDILIENIGTTIFLIISRCSISLKARANSSFGLKGLVIYASAPLSTPSK